MLNFITKRLDLKPFQSADLETLHALFINPYVRQFLWDNEIIPKKQTEEILRINHEQFLKEKCGLWSVTESGRSEIIGFVGLWYFFNEPQPQLLYGLLPGFAKKGYATEASQEIINYAFGKLGFDYLIAATDTLNQGSVKVLERLNFKMTEAKTIDGLETLFFRLISS